MKNIIQKAANNYDAPTPKFWRRLGDSLLALQLFISGYGISEDIHWVAYAGLITGIVGKFLTNFFKKDA